MIAKKTISAKQYLTAIILTFNEEKHIERCIRSVLSVASQVFVVDSFSSDRTTSIADSLGVKVYQRKFINQADQFQWALSNLPIESEWVMRMDADEYLEPGLQEELRRTLPHLDPSIDGLYIKRKVFFYGKWIRFGGFYPHILLRVWRDGKGNIEQRWMDEHIVLPPGSKTLLLKEHMVDDNLKGITFWINKHNSYASREAVEMLNKKYPLFQSDERMMAFDDPQAKRKRMIKDKVYARLPIGVRALAYFFYRYFLRFGFLDGPIGFVWHFMQGFWYRLLVDVKIMEIEQRCQGDVEKMKQVLRDEHGIPL